MEIHSGGRQREGKLRRRPHQSQGLPTLDIEKAWEPVLKHNLQLYNIPPVDTISLLDFENLAIDRLKVLKAVESAGQCYQKGSEDYNNYLSNEFRNKLDFKMGFKCTSVDKPESGEEVEERRKDHISHFILRLAFCKSPDQRSWFLQQEGDLFRYRFTLEGKKSITTFLQLNGFHYETVEGKSLNPDTLQNIADASDKASSSVRSSEMFKAAFTDGLDLVKGRKVYMEKGMIYVLRNDLIYLVAGKFRSDLSRNLTTTSKYLGFMQEQDRLFPIMKRLSSKAYVGKDYCTNPDTNQVTPDMIDSLSESSFPLCMHELHKNLRKQHHLKHGGRMQYGLFLKGIGLSLNDAMTFWRSEFTKLMDPDKFEKQYAYNIRHNYGKEGKRADYTPFSCFKIISSNKPGPQDSHGCPFQEMDPVILRQQLENLQVSSEDCEKIVGLSKKRQFDRACTRFFEATHKIPENSLGQLIAHPNLYFEESRKWRAGDKTPFQPVPTEHSQVFESQSSRDNATSGDTTTQRQEQEMTPSSDMQDNETGIKSSVTVDNSDSICV